MSEHSPQRSPRKFGAMAAGAVVGVVGLTGSVLALSQVAGADPDAAVVTADQNTDLDPEDLDLEHLDLEQLEAEFAEFDQCLVDQGVLSAEDLELMYSEDPFEDWDDGEWDEGEWDEGDWIDEVPHVAVVSGDQMTIAEFGDGDGSVTINKVDGEISVSTTGDVTEESIDFAELEAEFGPEFNGEFGQEFAEFGPEFEAEMEAWDAAFDACEHLAPEHLIEFDELADHEYDFDSESDED